MQDVALVQNATTGIYDVILDTNGDLKGTDSFDTALIVSLFSDARASQTQVAVPQNRRGWLGNVAPPIEGYEMGSLLWLVYQERLTQNVLNAAVDFARQCLEWLVVQGMAQSIDVSGEIVPSYGIALTIVITSLTGQTETRYVKLWENTANGS